MTNQQLFIRKVIKLALENVQSGTGGPFAALVVKENTIIASGTNSVTSTNDPTAHAEIVAIREACTALGSFQLQGCEVYCSCEPCPMCLGALYWARPAKIYFANTRQDAAAAGFDDSFIYSELAKSVQDRKIPTLQIVPDDALAALKEWVNKKDKMKY